MKWLLVLLVFAAPAQERTGVSSLARQGNRFLLRMHEGAAELEWVSPSTFRFRRTFGPHLPALRDTTKERVDVVAKESAAEITLSSSYLKAIIRKDDLRVEVRKAVDHAVLLQDLSPAARRAGAIVMDRLAQANAHYYGLGAKTTGGLNLRGSRVSDAIPFLFSTAGYGEHHLAAGRYELDLAQGQPDRYRITLRDSDTIDYLFYFGPTPKEIFEERLKATDVKFASQSDAPSLQWLTEQSLSGIILPVETVTKPVPAELRNRLGAYLAAYVQEVYDRGCPILHPLPVQFPRDAEADKYPDEAMLGDELLLAAGRKVYLPQGTWTNVKTNVASRGRQVIETTDAVSVFARNGSIVPLAGAGTLELHYFPTLGAEFFLYDEEAGDYTQTHAAPAADIMRLEIESKVARDYTWVVHHIEGVKGVASTEHSYSEAKAADQLGHRNWYYDAGRKDLHVRARVAAGEDLIVNISF